MPWFKDKVGTIWIFIKGKWVILATAIALLGTVGVNEILQEPPMLPDHVLKAPIEKILGSEEVDWIEGEPGALINKGRIISYDYISDKIIEQATFNGISEDMTKRNFASQQFKIKEETKKGIKTETWRMVVYSGSPFYYTEGKWHKIETATTTIAAFKKQVGRNVAYADISTTTYSGAGDGGVNYDDPVGPWATQRGAVSGNSATPANPNFYAVTDRDASGNFFIYRGVLPFYTAGIPAGSSITSSTLFIYVEANTNTDDDGNDFVGIVETFQASHTTLGVSDYSDIGYGDGGETYNQATSTNQVVGGQRDITATPINFYHDWGLDADGLSWITVNGQSSTCGSSLTGWTCLGIREGHDIVDDPPGPGTVRNLLRITSFEGGADSKPYMTIEYTVAAAAAEPDQYNVILFE